MGQRNVDVATLSRINVDKFYGIEIGEFPVRLAEMALWMMDHIMNNRLSLEFGDSYRGRVLFADIAHHYVKSELPALLPHQSCTVISSTTT